MNILAQSTVKPADIMTAPLRIVLRKRANGELVTHIQNMQDGGFFEGHYIPANEMGKALQDFSARCEKLGVHIDNE